MPDDTFPAGTDINALKEGYELHIAITTSGRFRNAPSNTLSEAQLVQRRAILDVNTRLLLKARDNALDEFAISWVKARNLLNGAR